MGVVFRARHLRLNRLVALNFQEFDKVSFLAV
jgi:hypothetical protein